MYSLKNRRQAVRLGFLLSSMVAWGGFHWIIYVAQNFGGMPLPLAIGLLLLFCLVAAPQMLAFLVLGERLRFRVERFPLWLRPFFWSSLYVALEYLAHFIKIFPENLGNTLIGFLSLAQAASLGGAPLLSFLPVFLGASLFYLRHVGKRAWPSVGAGIALIIGLLFWGTHERSVIEARPSQVLRIGLIQHNLDDAEKAFAKTSARDVVSIIVNRLLDKTTEIAAEKPDLVVWPETAYPMTYPISGIIGRGGSFAYGYANLVRQTIKQIKVPLLFGGYLSEMKKDYNAGILLGADGRVLDAYKKQVLLVFGEYFPLDNWFPSLKQINPQMGDFGRGPGPVPIELPLAGGKSVIGLGVNICYEAILPEYMRGYVKAGARLFVNLTKDSWFGDTFEPWQHFQLSLLRSIEHRIPMVRATNTGLSGLVLPTGETKILSLPFQEAYEVINVPVPVQDPGLSPTLYTRFGEWFAQLLLLLSCGMGFFIYKKR